MLISRGTLFEIEPPQSLSGTVGVNGRDPHSFYSIQPKEYECFVEDRMKSTSKLPKTLKKKGGACDDAQSIQNIVLDLADAVVDFCNEVDYSMKGNQEYDPRQVSGMLCVYRSEKPGSPSKSQIEVEVGNICTPLRETRKNMQTGTRGEACSSHDGQESDYFAAPVNCYSTVSFRDQPQNCSSSQGSSSTAGRYSQSDWPREGLPFSGLSWGGRLVGRRRLKAYVNQSGWANPEDWEAFISVFEGGGVLYCHMGFDELLHVRARLEELGFPCKAVSDGLWLQVG